MDEAPQKENLESQFKSIKRPDKPCDEKTDVEQILNKIGYQKQKNTQKKVVEHFIQKIKETKPMLPACGNPNADQPGMTQNMGLGKLAGKNIVFVRSFRWTLNAPDYPEITEWVQKISVNYVAKTMEIEAFDEADGFVFQWIADMMDDTKSVDFVLNHYDGCGYKLFYNSFEGIQVKDHSVGYDYESSEVVTHKLKLSYKNMKRSSNLKVN